MKIDFIARLTALRQLLVRFVPFEDTTPLANLIALEKLDLAHTKVKTVIGLQFLTSLQALDLTSTLVSNLEPLSKLEQIKTLSLRDTRIRSLEPLFGMRNLANLDISGCDAIDVNQLRAITSLRKVNLDQKQRGELYKGTQHFEIGRDLDLDFGFNLGMDERNFEKYNSWWSGPLDTEPY